VQVDPIKIELKPPGPKRLKLECDILLSMFAFKFKLRRYNEAAEELLVECQLRRQESEAASSSTSSGYRNTMGNQSRAHVPLVQPELLELSTLAWRPVQSDGSDSGSMIKQSERPPPPPRYLLPPDPRADPTGLGYRQDGHCDGPTDLPAWVWQGASPLVTTVTAAATTTTTGTAAGFAAATTAATNTATAAATSTAAATATTSTAATNTTAAAAAYATAAPAAAAAAAATAAAATAATEASTAGRSTHHKSVTWKSAGGDMTGAVVEGTARLTLQGGDDEEGKDDEEEEGDTPAAAAAATAAAAAAATATATATAEEYMDEDDVDDDEPFGFQEVAVAEWAGAKAASAARARKHAAPRSAIVRDGLATASRSGTPVPGSASRPSTPVSP